MIKPYFTAVCLAASAFAQMPKQQFVSTVQIVVKENSPRLKQRSQRLVMDELEDSIQLRPELQNRRYQIRTQGDRVVFYLFSDEDMRAPIQSTVSHLIERLKGRVPARGDAHIYRTNYGPDAGGYLDVRRMPNDPTKIISISAQSVPLRELLKELKSQMADFSYLIPGECAGKLVDWSFGEEGMPTQPKSIDAVMAELATLFNLRSEKQNGSFIFRGNCSNTLPTANVPHRQLSPELLAEQFFQHTPAMAAAQPMQVFFPLPLVGE